MGERERVDERASVRVGTCDRERVGGWQRQGKRGRKWVSEWVGATGRGERERVSGWL